MKNYALVVACSLSLGACASLKKENGQTAGAGGTANPAPPTPARAPAAAVVPARRDVQRAQGVEFVAAGTEPFWSLELGAARGLRFKSVGGVDSLTAPLPPPARAQDAQVVRYRAVTAAGELVVTIAKRPCTNAMSGEALAYTVTVLAKTTAMTTAQEFTGCGTYLGDYRLHDIWALESVDGQAVSSGQFAQDKPYLEINLSTQQVLGFAGCNRFSGPVAPESAGIGFGPLRSTRLSCPALPFEQKFLEILSDHSFAHRIENRRLTLENRSHALVFKKVD
ncbi:META domain-containing protein [Hymenobacter sp.]|uniref:META domain-containing protein n=1 Tax=Hymenobacter sp. TaxID=1898978 RepID=UPI00286CCEE8|nr:META domain-containing protein [Hymenobacter sp.]